jgi:hypothetical protein
VERASASTRTLSEFSGDSLPTSPGESALGFSDDAATSRWTGRGQQSSWTKATSVFVFIFLLMEAVSTLYGSDGSYRTADDPGDRGFDPPGDAQHCPSFIE